MADQMYSMCWPPAQTSQYQGGDDQHNRNMNDTPHH